MAQGTRGKLKEHVQGIHRDCEWIRTHCMESIKLLGDGYEQHRKAFTALHDIAVHLDDFAQKLYGQL